MANEPQREIEQNLAAYARQRRDEAGAAPPLHPATRKMLQGEVARTWPSRRNAPGFWTRVLAGGWPRLAIGFGVVLLAGFAVVCLRAGRKQTFGVSSLALNSYKAGDVNGNRARSENQPAPAADLPARDGAMETQKEMPADKLTPPAPLGLAPSEPAAAPSGTASGNLKMDGTQTFSDETKNLRKLDLSKSAEDRSSLPPATAGPVGAGFQGGVYSSGSAGGTIISSGKLETPQSAAAAVPAPRVEPPAPAQPAAPPALAAERERGAIGGAGGGGGGGGFGVNSTTATHGATTQQFARVDTVAGTRRAGDISGAAQVLSSFRVEQTGDQLRIIDSDGSVYLGAKISDAQNAPVAQFAAKAKTAAAPPAVAVDKDAADFKMAKKLDVPPGAPANAAAAPVAQGYAFQVRGTNLTLKQEIVFSGSFTPEIQPAPTTAAAPAVSSVNGIAPTGGEFYRLPLSQSRVSGRAVIGGTNQLDINAEAAKP